jgi:hypothetical protein
MADRGNWPTRKLRLEDEDKHDDMAHLTASQRVAMVWEITKDAWAHKDAHVGESRLRRDVARVVRGRR